MYGNPLLVIMRLIVLNMGSSTSVKELNIGQWGNPGASLLNHDERGSQTHIKFATKGDGATPRDGCERTEAV
jgi:hypothetical protein